MTRAIDPNIEAAIQDASRRSGVPADTIRTFVNIESGGRPNTQTGSYMGLLQLSQDEFRKHGGQGNPFDVSQNLNAGSTKLAAETRDFTGRYGRPPSASELYMIHQQGVGGSAAHWANPDQPAWMNMHSTAEGQQKGPRWAQQAIWGNVPDDLKRQYGDVSNVTSKQFTDMWTNKVARMGGGDATPQQPQPPDGMDAATYGMPNAPRNAGPAVGGGNAAPGGTNSTDNILLSALAGGTDYGDWQGVQHKNEQLAQQGQSAASRALSSIDTPNGAQPHVDISRLLAALKARGVDPTGPPNLGTNQKPQLGSA